MDAVLAVPLVLACVLVAVWVSLGVVAVRATDWGEFRAELWEDGDR